MIKTTDNFKVTVKAFFNCVKGIINYSMLALLLGSLIYFVYWAIFSNSEYILEETKNFFNPIAEFIWPSLIGQHQIYIKTSLALFGFIIPMLVVYGIVDGIEDKILQCYYKSQARKSAKLLKKLQKEKLKQFDKIKEYSICLSVDYNSKKPLSKTTKKELNQIMFNKIKNVIKLLKASTKINSSEVLIVTSVNFEKYDLVNDAILKVLAKEQKIFKTKFDIDIIPSMTTDAYTTQDIALDKVKNTHLIIQTFNFKNRACSTALFSQKYKHLNHKKYAGVPIGEYAYFADDKPTETYELNIINKNLSETIAA